MQLAQRNLMGERFGKLVVVGVSRIDEQGRVWLCKCDCGTTGVGVKHQDLLTGKIIRCPSTICDRPPIETRGRPKATGAGEGVSVRNVRSKAAFDQQQQAVVRHRAVREQPRYREPWRWLGEEY